MRLAIIIALFSWQALGEQLFCHGGTGDFDTFMIWKKPTKQSGCLQTTSTDENKIFYEDSYYFDYCTLCSHDGYYYAAGTPDDDDDDSVIVKTDLERAEVEIQIKSAEEKVMKATFPRRNCSFR